MVHLIIYGVFDRGADRCIKVGSTVKPLNLRAKGYRAYKWYDSSKHDHRILWEGDIPRDEMLHFLRAAKEVCWIARMHTWYDQGGLNQMNPVLHTLRNPRFFSELCAAGGRNSFKWSQRRDHLSKVGKLGSHEDKVRAGQTGLGECKARRGEKHPYFGKPGPRLGMKTSEETKQKQREAHKDQPGKPHTVEFKKMMSGRMSGSNNPSFGSSYGTLCRERKKYVVGWEDAIAS